MLRWAPTGRKCDLQSAGNERFVRCGADRTLARKKHTAQWFRRSQTLIEFPIFCAENGQSIGKQRIVEEKAPRKKQNVEDFEQNLHLY
jgi:hypothetical protein